ncbi:type I-F CRISPR-associated protein Csy3 [Acetobacter sp. AAB5]|uniref:type I-F CRISPR-associated protein Csy3 n=1 Tax=Acetobacter sp. AAB5 TaxID=3418370 RepID=UPI003CF8EB0E
MTDLSRASSKSIPVNEISNPSVLAFERKIDPSDAIFTSGSGEPIILREKAVRGTISNRIKKEKDADPAKLDAAIESPNLQTVDVATLPVDGKGADTLEVTFNVRVIGNVGDPCACNEPNYRNRLRSVVDEYAARDGFRTLGLRYAENLANARALWRNRLSAQSIETTVKFLQDGKTAKAWTFDSFSLHLNEAGLSKNRDVIELGEVIAGALAGKSLVFLEVVSRAQMAPGLEVFPSQELIMERTRNGKSRTLYAVETKSGPVAALHSQKVGNALRTVDTWYPGSDGMPIAAEMYGAVTTMSKAFRQPRQKRDFYNLLDGWMLKNKVPSEGDQHYVMACIIRGGVFGSAE